MTFDLKQLVEDIKTAASTALHKDVSALKGYSERQVKSIAKQSEFVALGIASGGITDETKDFFLDSLKDMALNFVKTLHGLLLVTIERVWNAVVGVIWNAISRVTNLMLPIPTHFVVD